MIFGIRTVRVENVKDLEGVKKSEGVVVGRVGAKKRKDILAKAKEMGVRVLNRYLEKRNKPRTNADERGRGDDKKLKGENKFGEEKK